MQTPLVIRSATTLAGLAFGLALATGVRGDAPATKSAKGAAETPEADDAKAPGLRKQLYTGKVVLLTDALTKRGIKSYEEMKGQVVLETFDGRLFPIVADWRGRAFFQDKRLRDRKVEIIGNHRPGIPYLQVLAVYTFDEKDRRQFTDYWCDVCEIPMYEIKPCDCCQDDTRLRFRLQKLPDYLEGPARIPIGRKPTADDARTGNNEAGDATTD